MSIGKSIVYYAWMTAFAYGWWHANKGFVALFGQDWADLVNGTVMAVVALAGALSVKRDAP